MALRGPPKKDESRTGSRERNTRIEVSRPAPSGHGSHWAERCSASRDRRERSLRALGNGEVVFQTERSILVEMRDAVH